MALTPKQEAFCMSYLETGNASEAYRRSYDASKMGAATINVKACNLLADDKVRVRIEELKAKVVDQFVWERKDSLAVLSEIANSKDEASKDRISAVKELNNMHGYNAPSNVNHQFVDKDGQPVSGITITVKTVSPGEVK